MRHPMIADRPWHYVHIDLWQPGIRSAEGHKYVLTAIDRLTHWPEMVPIKSKTAEAVADAFFTGRVSACFHARQGDSLF